MFNITGGMSVLNGYFLTALPQAVFRTQHNRGHVSFNWLFFWQYCHELYLEPNITGKMSVLNGYFLTVCHKLYLEPNQKSTVKLFCKNS